MYTDNDLNTAQEQQLAESLMFDNAQYRAGTPRISDDEYDAKHDKLAEINPNHPLVNNVEPELLSGQTFSHTTPMLSTDKAYFADDVGKWLNKIEQAGIRVGQPDPMIRATAKLDGVACKLIPEPLTLATRGDGNQGNVITHLLDLGMDVFGDTSSEAVGELVMPKWYFDQHLAQRYSHPRNFVAGIVNADSHNDDAVTALKNGGVHLVMFKNMPAVEMPLSEFRDAWEDVETHLRNSEYPIDGVVFETTNPSIKKAMGSNTHHHHWQLAKKQKAEAKETTVTNVTYQVGRTGLITPVVHIEPVDLDGAVTSKVTAHHVGNMERKQIGVGARVTVLRAGEVIPFLSSVITPASELNTPRCCPECGANVAMKEDFLFCQNDDCTGRSDAKIIHHFSLLNALLFGKVTAKKIVNAGFNSIEHVYQMTKTDFVSAGLGDGQAQNLLNEIARIKTDPLPDYLLVASLGISKLGRGSAKKLLTHYRIDELATLTLDQIQAIDGFGQTSAQIIHQTLHQNPLLAFLLEQGFNIQHTQEQLKKTKDTPESSLSGKSVVFTGKCSLSRDEMADYAQSLGCIVQERVAKDTDFLVCGEKVGATKIESAKKKGAQVISEAEFRDMASPNKNGDNASITTPINVQPNPTTPLANTETAVGYQSDATLEDKENTMIDTNVAQAPTQKDGELIRLNPSALNDPEWGNPRTSLADADYLDLLNSIKAKGVHTPVFVRFVNGEYQLIAGFTRRRAAIEAEIESIPCIIRQLDDKQAYELAVSENVDRTNMSALDEAASLKEIVKRHNGDAQAASQEMGWSRAKFNRAIQLLRASDYVRSLVGKKQENGFALSVAHAARLSTLPETLQDKLVTKVIDEKMSVAVLGDKINKVVKRPLSSAAFCKDDCQRCEYNSDVQTSMFAEDNADAHCTNPTCFAKKTTEHYDNQVKELEKDYGKIVLLSTVDDPIKVSPDMVGQEQYTGGCLSCDKHCAILADKGIKQNEILESQCLDADCATGHAKALKASIERQATSNTTQATSETAAPTAKTEATQPATQKTAKAKTQAAPPKRLILESQNHLREVGKDLLMAHPSYQLAVTLSALKAQASNTHRMEEGVIELMAHSPEQLQHMMVETIAELTHSVQTDALNMERTIIRAAQTHIDDFDAHAIEQWKPTKERLAAMTKAIRQQALEKSGFAAAFKAEKGEKAYNALMNKKTDDAVSDILAFEFDWSAYAPDYYTNAITTQKYNF